ncbi:AAA family ATPase, partial [Rhodococcus sp. (in: high G+C Gram-positive bacteria)]|uniref:helix-turn-helix transcriptional regulator n=1 Tax=Rhodococcus sp. TaxID=1831 RepID=UPI00388ED1AD
MDNRAPSERLVGRAVEKAWLSGLLQSAVEGRGVVGVLRGDAGMGKTYLVCSVLSEHPRLGSTCMVGVESEADLPYAALQRMMLSHRPVFESLPVAQRSALGVACGMAAGPSPSRSLVGLGLLTFLARLSDDAPFVCFIDDAQWIDPESLQALAFVGRRLLVERVALLFAVRTEGFVSSVLDDLPGRTLEGLDRADARRLLRTSSCGPLDHRVVDRIVDATGGNPLALVDLPGELTLKQLRGEDFLHEPVPLGKHLEAHYLKQIRGLPRETRTWLLAAAAEPEGDLDAITAAGEALGLPEAASHRAELAGLVRVDSTVTFRHPLVRSAVYNGAPSPELRRVHSHLAGVAHERGDVHKSVTHRAAATVGTDDEVAEELERSADIVTQRGGYMTRADLLVRAAALTSDAARKELRILAAGESALVAGAGAQAGALLASLDPARLDDAARGRLLLALCELEVLTPVTSPVFAHRPQRLLATARYLHSLDPAHAKQAVANAFWALIQADELAQGTTSREVADEARHICRTDPGSDLTTQALVALSTLILDGRAAASPLVKEAVARATTNDTADEEILQSYMCIAHAACLLREPDAVEAVLRHAERAAQRQGAALALARVLLLRAYSSTQRGRIGEGTDHLTRAGEIIAFMGLPQLWTDIALSLPIVRGWRGDETVTDEDDEVLVEAHNLGYGRSGASRLVGAMLLRAAEGRYAEAWHYGRRIGHEDPFFTGTLYLADLIECAARAGDRDSAEKLIRQLTIECRDTQSRWAAGLLERSMTHFEGEDTASRCERALELLTGPALEMDAARTHLLYGEWLRRRRRRTDAAQHLAAALETFLRLGAAGWATRAQRELDATGKCREPNASRGPSPLTPQEASVARLAAAGNTNTDIASQLFVSPNTVDYHLRKVFRKLGV